MLLLLVNNNKLLFCYICCCKNSNHYYKLFIYVYILYLVVVNILIITIIISTLTPWQLRNHLSTNNPLHQQILSISKQRRSQPATTYAKTWKRKQVSAWQSLRLPIQSSTTVMDMETIDTSSNHVQSYQQTMPWQPICKQTLTGAFQTHRDILGLLPRIPFHKQIQSTWTNHVTNLSAIMTPLSSTSPASYLHLWLMWQSFYEQSHHMLRTKSMFET